MANYLDSVPLQVIVSSLIPQGIPPETGNVRERRSIPWLSRMIKHRLARSSRMWHSRAHFTASRLQPKGPPPIKDDDVTAARRLFGDYVRVVSQHGFDSGVAAEFKAAHHADKDFLRKAAAHDRMVFLSFRAREGKKKTDNPERGL